MSWSAVKTRTFSGQALAVNICPQEVVYSQVGQSRQCLILVNKKKRYYIYIYNVMLNFITDSGPYSRHVYKDR